MISTLPFRKASSYHSRTYTCASRPKGRFTDRDIRYSIGFRVTQVKMSKLNIVGNDAGSSADEQHVDARAIAFTKDLVPVETCVLQGKGFVIQVEPVHNMFLKSGNTSRGVSGWAS